MSECSIHGPFGWVCADCADDPRESVTFSDQLGSA
jgi:hypothetical protein